jgi:hypothetical protein
MRHPGTTVSSTVATEFLVATQTVRHDAAHPAAVTLPLGAGA